MTEAKDILDGASFSPQDALVALMMTVSVSDATIRTSELLTIERTVDHLPVFADYDTDRIGVVSQTVFDLLEEEDGLDAIIGLVRSAVPRTHWETAYALSCDIAAADGKLKQSELRMLQELREELEIDPLHAAAIERGARARHLRF
ncbi:tellurite resistance TerB family protein [Jannaschia sp. W003]|uniref:tellurite resistance TerB family protein n=1 Tax=Jannaschia sp. W003 TaxID=2867012 RepID=UPI0021A2F7AD|nr:tellurite resistance TerB family protein [Jannaschia sp. W003]UWQ21640.1 tellurite resistance TerB family protein [Jannaschia sp. W003]